MGFEQHKSLSLQDIRRLKSEEKIINAARSVFVEQGYKGASISQIAKNAGVPQSLIYHYYSNKEALWKAVKKDALDKTKTTAAFGGENASDFEEFLEKVCKGRVDFYDKNPSIRKLVAWEKLQSDKDNLFGIEPQFKGMWTQDLERLKTERKLDESVDERLLGVFIRNAIDGAIEDIPRLYNKQDVKKVRADYLELVKRCLKVLSK